MTLSPMSVDLNPGILSERRIKKIIISVVSLPGDLSPLYGLIKKRKTKNPLNQWKSPQTMTLTNLSNILERSLITSRTFRDPLITKHILDIFLDVIGVNKVLTFV